VGRRDDGADRGAARRGHADGTERGAGGVAAGAGAAGDGGLRDCDHCGCSYALSAVLVPGILVHVARRLDDAWFCGVGGMATLLSFTGVWCLLGVLPRRWGAAVRVGVVPW
jgi:hypothetical protein